MTLHNIIVMHKMVYTLCPKKNLKIVSETVDVEQWTEHPQNITCFIFTNRFFPTYITHMPNLYFHQSQKKKNKNIIYFTYTLLPLLYCKNCQICSWHIDLLLFIVLFYQKDKINHSLFAILMKLVIVALLCFMGGF